MNPNIKLSYPTAANEVFAKFPKSIIAHHNSIGYQMNEKEFAVKSVRRDSAWKIEA